MMLQQWCVQLELYDAFGTLLLNSRTGLVGEHCKALNSSAVQLLRCSYDDTGTLQQTLTLLVTTGEGEGAPADIHLRKGPDNLCKKTQHSM